MPYVYSPGFDGMVVNMDYNMWVKYNGGTDEPETAPDLREKVYQTYKYIYDETYNGNRAPVIIANHFNDWNGDSFNPAVLKFMHELLRQAEHLLHHLLRRDRLDGSCRTPTICRSCSTSRRSPPPRPADRRPVRPRTAER